MPHRNQEQSTHPSITVESPFFFIRLYIFPRKGATRSSHPWPALACMHLIPMTDRTIIWSRLLLHFAKMHVVMALPGPLEICAINQVDRSLGPWNACRGNSYQISCNDDDR
ncbi:hypothetical protein CY34DRAFT_339014 [Suillus luteus UH-Slu-Lm8-n1]|uniref:Uncharacterized protein n=1 Tax=Suillus luteus UH-Slu-Lm8-n1 TaxID=930992 RepID=A0A0D0ACE0_9AGAM|nr:hypothetical protein CY34DRAFT_339014 [Suillus luteus UH-Slu-Lm8-n1]